MDTVALENLERAMTAVARQAGPGDNDPADCATDAAETPSAIVTR
jgi:hypothetical protein